MGELTALIERVEKASGADRELDALIRAELENRDVRTNGQHLLGRSRVTPHDECLIGFIDPGKTSRNFSIVWSEPPCPYYTASIDAALTLLPERCAWDAGTTISFRSEATVYGHNIHENVDAATPALALTAACLKARAVIAVATGANHEQ